MKDHTALGYTTIAIIGALFGAIFWWQWLQIGTLGRTPKEPQRPAVINWVDVPAKDPASDRAFTIQLGLRDDNSIVWRMKP